MWSGYTPVTSNAPIAGNGVNNPYQYQKQTTPNNTVTNTRYTPPGIGTKTQTTSPTTVPTTNVPIGTYNPGPVNLNRGNPNTNTITVPNNKFQTSMYEQVEEAKAALAAVEVPKQEKDNSSPYYWLNGKRHKKNTVILNAKGKPIHNWRALAGLPAKQKAATVTFEAADVSGMDLGSSGQFSWRI